MDKTTKLCKLIAVDMDGTLLTSSKNVHPDTITDIEYAVDNGIEIAYCTGRAISELEAFFKELPMIRYAVSYSGAILYDCIKRECLYRNEIGAEYIGIAVDTALKYKGMPHFLTADESIVSKVDITHMEDFHMGVYQPMFERIARQVEDMRAEAGQHDSIAKINLYFQSALDRDSAYRELIELPLAITHGEGASIELTARNVTKAQGLYKLSELLKIPMECISGIGDADNDREMLKNVGFSVAMGNAAKDIKDECDYVTEDCDHNGVGLAIRHIVRNCS